MSDPESTCQDGLGRIFAHPVADIARCPRPVPCFCASVLPRVFRISQEAEEKARREKDEKKKEEAKTTLKADLPCMRNIVLRMVGAESQHVVWLMNPPWAHSYNFGLDRNWQEALDCVATFGRTMLMHSQMQVEHPPRPLHMSWR